MPTITVEHELEIRRPAGEVFDFLSDHAHLPAWTAGIKRAARTSPGPVGVGTTYRVTAKMLGRRVRSTYEVTAYEPERLLAGRMTSPILDYEETYRFEGYEAHTLLKLHVEAHPRRWLRLLGPLLAVGMHRQVPIDHRRLRAVVERSGRARARAGRAPQGEPDPTREDDPGEGDAGQ